MLDPAQNMLLQDHLIDQVNKAEGKDEMKAAADGSMGEGRVESSNRVETEAEWRQKLQLMISDPKILEKNFLFDINQNFQVN